MIQHALFKCETQYGGTYSLRKAKTKRPLSSKKALHVVMRSQIAHGSYSLLHQENEVNIRKILEAQSTQWGIRVYEFAVNSNHCHIVLRGKTRESIQNFFRAFAGLVARSVTGAK